MGTDPSDLDVLETPDGAVRVSDEGDGMKWKPAQGVDDDDVNHHLHHLQPKKNNQWHSFYYILFYYIRLLFQTDKYAVRLRNIVV